MSDWLRESAIIPLPTKYVLTTIEFFEIQSSVILLAAILSPPTPLRLQHNGFVDKVSFKHQLNSVGVMLHYVK